MMVSKIRTIELELLRPVQDLCVAQCHHAEFMDLLKLQQSVKLAKSRKLSRALLWLFNQLLLEMFVPSLKPARPSTPIAAACIINSFTLFMAEIISLVNVMEAVVDCSIRRER